MARDEAALPQGEGAQLLQWFLDGHFTLLGHQIWHRDGSAGEALGIARHAHDVPVLAESSRALA
ncbi:NAD-glutamate dehydrogenase, partial [Escherichia coli]|nr:NAD-glutamate dehydrogenase [Escherichia coli]